MNFLHARDGKQQGPYPLESLPEMLRYGGVKETDHILVDGAPGWVCVADYLPKQPASPPPLAAPPVAPPPLPRPGAVPTDDVIAAVEAGGRYVVFPYCFSIVVLTFRQSSEVTFLRRDEDGASQAITYSILSAVVGWWGIPWGPIWTIGALITNARGGKDLTREVLTERYGATAADSIMARRKPPAPAGWLMKTYRAILILIALIPFSLIVVPLCAGLFAGAGNPGVSNSGRSSAFEAANSQIAAHHGQVAFGNSPPAIAIAGQIAGKMKTLRTAFFSGGKPDGVSLSKHEFLTYCDLRDNQCIVLVHVPELRNFKEDAKDTLATLVWQTTQSALRDAKAGTNDMKVLVGIRGVMLYDRALVGAYVSDPDTKGNGLIDTVKNGRDTLKQAFEAVKAPISR